MEPFDRLEQISEDLLRRKEIPQKELEDYLKEIKAIEAEIQRRKQQQN